MALKTNHGWVITHANRVAWFLAHGPIPSGLIVCHNCPNGDSPDCVNPDHLYLGTDAHNVCDSERKGQSFHLRGDAISKKHTSESIRRFLVDVKINGIPRGKSALKNGISIGTAKAVLMGKAWREVSSEFGVKRRSSRNSPFIGKIELPPLVTQP